MNKLENKKINIIDKIKNNKKIQYILIAITLIIITIIFGISFISKKNNNQITNDVNTYVNNLETRLSELLSKIKGVGKTSVLIKVDGGMQTIIAKKTVKTEVGGRIEIEETPILVNGKTVTLQEIYPDVLGVIIVAEGAENFSVMRKIQDATISFLGVDINKIEILSMK